MAKRQPRANTDREAGESLALPQESASCWLCQRPLGRRVEWHHPVPKSRGGRRTVAVHPICHRTLHAHFTNAELARMGEDVEALRRDEAVARFMAWVAGKHPDFHAPTAKKASS